MLHSNLVRFPYVTMDSTMVNDYIASIAKAGFHKRKGTLLAESCSWEDPASPMATNRHLFRSRAQASQRVEHSETDFGAGLLPELRRRSAWKD